MCGHAGKNVQLQARPRGLIGVRREFNLLLHPIVIRRLTTYMAHRKSSNIVDFLLSAAVSPLLLHPLCNLLTHSL